VKKATVFIAVMTLLLCVSVTSMAFINNIDGGQRPKPTATETAKPPQIQKPPEKLLQYKVLKTYKKVMKTVYYGPKKNQKFYINGTYAEDVKMNGKGEFNTAGEKPRYGTLAADPQLFPEGTKILMIDPLDGQEKIFEVKDEGPKVKKKHLDQFVGFGNEGAKLVRKIGTQYIDIKVVRVLNS
jgi:3D (Asp-Asp-Asp) domain-containing protein